MYLLLVCTGACLWRAVDSRVCAIVHGLLAQQGMGPLPVDEEHHPQGDVAFFSGLLCRCFFLFCFSCAFSLAFRVVLPVVLVCDVWRLVGPVRIGSLELASCSRSHVSVAAMRK